MSRIGNKPIPVPSAVKYELSAGKIKVTGPKGSLERSIRPEIVIEEQDGQLVIKGKDNSKRTNAFRGMTRSLINNMIVGTVEGFRKKLVVEGVGYRVGVAGSKLTLHVGFSNPVDFILPDGVKATVNNNEIVIDGINKEEVGLVAAKIRDIKKPEPYKGKGIRYENEHIVRKVGKAAGKK